MSGWPAEQKRRLRPRRARLTFDIVWSSEVLAAGHGGRSVHVAVEELAAARADAVEDRRVPDALPQEILTDAAENIVSPTRAFFWLVQWWHCSCHKT